MTSLGDGFGSTRDEFVAACKLAVGVNTKLLSGGCPVLKKERAFVIETLNEYRPLPGIGKPSRKIRARVARPTRRRRQVTPGRDHRYRWFGTQAGDVVRAIKELKGRIFQVHLKDVLASPADQNVGWGNGIVPMKECVVTLRDMSYTGLYSVEIHSVDHDPSAELEAAGQMLREWLGMPGRRTGTLTALSQQVYRACLYRIASTSSVRNTSISS